MPKKPKLCSVQKCERPHYNHGFCRRHAYRFLRYGDPLGGRIPKYTCSVENCDKPHYGHGFCQWHAYRFRTYGDPLFVSQKTNIGDPLRYLQDVVLNWSSEECLPWPYARSGGYGEIYINGENKHVHRVVCTIIHGEPSSDLEARHLCGKGHEGCVNPKHIIWGTHTDNCQDKIRHGTTLRGERHHEAKLSDADVRKIRAMRGVLHREIAEMFGVHPATVSGILGGKKRRYG